MNIGVIKWFDSEKGFGVIVTNEELYEHEISKNYACEVFLHKSNWKDLVPASAEEKIPIFFNTAIERNKLTAKDCRYYPNNVQSWKFILNKLDTNDEIIYELDGWTKKVKIVSNALIFLNDNFNEEYFIEALSQFLNETSDIELERITLALNSLLKVKLLEKIKIAIREKLLYRILQVDFKLKLEFFTKGFIQLDQLSNVEIVDNYILLNFDTIYKLGKVPSKQYAFVEVLSSRVKSLKSSFSIEIFNSFEQYLSLIEDEGIKYDLLQQLNEIASDHYLISFIKELSDHEVIKTQKELIELKNERTAIPKFIDNSIVEEIDLFIEQHIIEKASPDLLTYACIHKFFQNSDKVILQNIQNITSLDKQKVIETNGIFSTETKKEILSDLIDKIEDYEWILHHAGEFGDIKYFEQIDERIFSKIPSKEYFKLWVRQKGYITPKELIMSILVDNVQPYENLKSWFEKGIISKPEVEELLFNKLNETTLISSRKDFFTAMNIIQLLVDLDIENVSSIRNGNNSYFLLILWFLNHHNSLDFNLLKGKFIYFKPEQQILILKRLFYLKVIGEFDFSIETLDELIRADVDLFLLNEKFNTDIVLDLTTDIIIEGIKKFKDTGRFLIQSDLLKLVLKDVGNDKTRKFSFNEFFDKCPGRMIAKFGKGKDKIISKVPYGNKSYYFKIDFEYDQDIVEGIRNIPGRKYNNVEHFWGVPSIYENEVLKFAAKFGFFLDFDGNVFENNLHLFRFDRDNKPNGIEFCNGINSQKEDNLHKRPFWWCLNNICYEHTVKIHSSEDWEKYTLLDFLTIFGYSVVEKSNYGLFPTGLYLQFITQINRFNQLLERMYCRECNNILYPVEIGKFAAYAVIRFSCQNEKCSEKGNEIYLNHCLNGKCNTLIDSRDSKKCPNELYICNVCGCCCSHSMFVRRLETLTKTGSNIHPNLIFLVNEKKGHLEKAEHFCYKCSKDMPEGPGGTFTCLECKVIYETNKFKFPREHRHLRSADYPTLKTF